jgi:biopolymer transport protein ExbB
MPIPIKLKWLLIVTCLACIAGFCGNALAQGDTNGAITTEEQSFFGAFFVSKVTHADGTESVDIVGSIMLWTLLILSVVNIGMIGYLAMTNQRKAIIPDGVVNEVRRMLGAGDYKQALDLTRHDDSFFSKVLHAGLTASPQGLTAATHALEQTADSLITARMRPIEFLYMLGQVSPMMGLLGTVYGIIFAFRVFVSMGGNASPALLAGGIGTALVATFWGLIVAIPALGGYAVLRGKVDALTMEASLAAEEAFSHFRTKPTVGVGGPSPKPAYAKPGA